MVNRFRPQVDQLGARLAPAVVEYIGTDPTDPAHYLGSVPPANGDTLVINENAGDFAAYLVEGLAWLGGFEVRAGYGESAPRTITLGDMDIWNVDWRGGNTFDVDGSVRVHGGMIDPPDFENRMWFDTTGGSLWLSGDGGWDTGGPGAMSIRSGIIRLTGALQLGGYSGNTFLDSVYFRGPTGEEPGGAVVYVSGDWAQPTGGVIFNKSCGFSHMDVRFRDGAFAVLDEGDPNRGDDDAILGVSGGTVFVEGGAQLMIERGCRLVAEGAADVVVSQWNEPVTTKAAVIVQGSGSRLLLQGGEVRVARGDLFTDGALFLRHGGELGVAAGGGSTVTGRLYVYEGGTVDFYADGRGVLQVVGDVNINGGVLRVDVNHAAVSCDSLRYTGICRIFQSDVIADSGIYVEESGKRPGVEEHWVVVEGVPHPTTDDPPGQLSGSFAPDASTLPDGAWVAHQHGAKRVVVATPGRGGEEEEDEERDE